jgi:hypothetical protein
MSDSKFEQAVHKVFELTHLGEIVWTKKSPPKSLTMGTESAFPLYFEATYQGRQLALFEERFYQAHSDVAKAAARMFGESGRDGWREKAVLALLDDDGDVVYEFPSTRETQALLRTVCHKESKVENFIDELLNKEPTGA